MRQSVLAAFPIGIRIIGLLFEWLWSPVIFGFERIEYPVVGLASLAIFALGAAWGVAQRLPVWSFTWIIFFLAELARLASAFFAELPGSRIEVGWVVFLSNLGELAAVIAVAVIVGLRSMRLAFLVALLSLLYGALRFPMISDLPLAGDTAGAATVVFAVLAAAEAAVVIFGVTRFLGHTGKPQRQALYLLAAVVLVDPFMGSWAYHLAVSDSSLGNSLMTGTATVGGTWGSVAITLLLTWGLTKAASRVILRKTSETSSRAEAP